VSRQHRVGKPRTAIHGRAQKVARSSNCGGPRRIRTYDHLIKSGDQALPGGKHSYAIVLHCASFVRSGYASSSAMVPSHGAASCQHNVGRGDLRGQPAQVSPLGALDPGSIPCEGRFVGMGQEPSADCHHDAKEDA
jgi:hypothetical protein